MAYARDGGAGVITIDGRRCYEGGVSSATLCRRGAITERAVDGVATPLCAECDARLGAPQPAPAGDYHP